MTKSGGRGSKRKAQERHGHSEGTEQLVPLTCSIHGPGVDVDVRVENAGKLAELARTFMSGVGEGIVFMSRGGDARAPAPAGPSPEDYAPDPALLRRTVAEDLRQMWDAMWKDGPVHIGDLESRDARFEAWVMGPAGQAIIDDALAGPHDPSDTDGTKMRRN